MAYTFTSYFLNEELETAFNQNNWVDPFINDFPEIKLYRAKFNQVCQSLGAINVNPLAFSITLAYVIYLEEKGIPDLPDGDDDPQENNDVDSDAPLGKLFMDLTTVPGKIKLSDGSADILGKKLFVRNSKGEKQKALKVSRQQQFNYILAKADLFLGWIHFKCLSGEKSITDEDEDEVLYDMGLIGFGAANYIYRFFYTNPRNCPAKMAAYMNFSDYVNITYTTIDVNSLYIDNISPKAFIYPVDNKVFMQFNISNRVATNTDSLRQMMLVMLSFTKPDNYDLTYKCIANHQEDPENYIDVVGPQALYDRVKSWLRPYYYLNGGGVRFFIGRAYVEMSSGGSSGGKGRSDSVTENLYKWQGNIYLGFALGLCISNHTSKMPGFKLPDGFMLTNTPFDKDECYVSSERTRTHSRSMEDYLQLVYWKKQRVDARGITLDRKNLPQVYGKPRTFNIGKDYKRFKRNIMVRKKVKGANAVGEILRHRQLADRLNAATVMGKFLMPKKIIGTDQVFYDVFNAWSAVRESKSRLSATKFANYVVNQDGVLRTALGDDTLPFVKNNRVTTSQEWCHFYGHGDGGSEIGGNFVSGSKHCNTEQLAIETGQRKRQVEGLTAKITAYLFPVSGVTANDDRSNFSDENPVNPDLEYFPLASLMRYKIFYKGPQDARSLKIFDHWYDAQSESFDYNEFLILEEYVDRKICTFATGMRDKYRASLVCRFLKQLKSQKSDEFDMADKYENFIKAYNLKVKQKDGWDKFYSTAEFNFNDTGVLDFQFNRDNHLLRLPDDIKPIFEAIN